MYLNTFVFANISLRLKSFILSGIVAFWTVDSWCLYCLVLCGFDLKFQRLTSSFSKNSVYSAFTPHVSKFIAF